MDKELRTKVLHDLRRIALCISQLMSDLDKVAEEVDKVEDDK